MTVVNKITCPNCHAPLKSARGIRIGKKIKCVKCEVAFTVRAEDAEQAELSGGVNAGRLMIVLVGALIFLSGGAALAYVCFLDDVPPQIAEVKLQPTVDENQPPAPPSIPKTPPVKIEGALSLAEQRAVDLAIADGVWFLKDHAFEGGVWNDENAIGLTALPALTLLECGVPASDPQIQKTAAFVREHPVKPALANPTYQRSLAILFLDRLGDRTDDELIQYLALCLIAGQNLTQGAWHYQCPTLDRKETPKLLKTLNNEKQTLQAWHKAALKNEKFKTGGWDNSNTQFAVLALWVASRHGVPIAKPIKLVEQHFRKTQQPDGEPDGENNNLNLGGSWLYDTRGNSSKWPSMTCSGLLALAVAHGLDDEKEHASKKPTEDLAIKRALAMLGREIGRPAEARPHDLYFLWSLERVGVLFDLRKIAGKDWYAWGRRDLLKSQNKDGSWTGGNYWGSNGILDTCFALLFLKQANLAKDLTNKLQLLGISAPTVQAPAAKKE